VGGECRRLISAPLNIGSTERYRLHPKTDIGSTVGWVEKQTRPCRCRVRACSQGRWHRRALGRAVKGAGTGANARPAPPLLPVQIKIYGAKVKVDSLTKVAEIEQAEVAKMIAKCEKINYNKPEQFFTDNGILSIEHADFEGVERLSAVLGGEIASTFEHPEMIKMGQCDKIEEMMIGEDRLIAFTGCKGGEACTLVLRGASTHILDEMERSIHDALCVLKTVVKDTRAIYGGGCSEVMMAEAVDELAKTTPGKKSLAIEAFAKALRTLPKTIAENGGYDATELVTQLRAAHNGGHKSAGLNMKEGSIGDMKEMGITESFRVKCQSLVSAAEAAEMVIRVDQVITCAPRQRNQEGY